MYNGQIILDGLNLTGCTLSSPDQSPTFDTGFVLEGLSVWANVSGDTGLINDVISLANTSMLFPMWTNPQGIIIEEPAVNISDFTNGYKGILVRGLHTARLRLGQDNPSFASLVDAFITTQFNALVGKASVPGSNIYSSSWTGPPPSILDSLSQILAFHVLDPAFEIATNQMNTTVPSPTPSPTPTGNGNTTHIRSHAGAIAGGVIGGLAFVAIAMPAVFFIQRRRKPPVTHGSYSSSTNSSARQISPFNLPQSQPMSIDTGPDSASSRVGAPLPVFRGLSDTKTAFALRHAQPLTPISAPSAPSSSADPPSEAAARGPDVEQILQSASVQRILEQRVFDIVSRVQPQTSEMPPDYEG